MVVFNWTKKILHIPTVIVSFLAAFVVGVCLPESPSQLTVPMHQVSTETVSTDTVSPEGAPTETSPPDAKTICALSTDAMLGIIGAIWFSVWLICHIIEDYDFNLTTVIASTAILLLAVVLIEFADVWGQIGRILKRISITGSAALYLGFGIAYLASIILSYLKGIFYYVAIEPNQVTVQYKIGEDAETFQKMHYDIKVETSVDIFEWFLYDMGTIKIVFQGGKRPSIDCYVGHIRKKAPQLANILGVTAVETDET